MGENPGQVISMAIECPEKMTYGDFMAMDAFLFSNMNMLYRDYLLAQEGLFTSAYWKSSVDAYAYWYLGNKFGRTWWDEEAKHFFNNEFTDHVDEKLQQEGKDSHDHWENIRMRIVAKGAEIAGGPCS